MQLTQDERDMLDRYAGGHLQRFMEKQRDEWMKKLLKAGPDTFQKAQGYAEAYDEMAKLLTKK